MRHMQRIVLAALFTSVAYAEPLPSWYTIVDLEVEMLGTLGGGDESVANDINDHGQIVGWSTNHTGRQRSFLHRNGAMEDITMGYSGEARGINNLTQVVGTVKTTLAAPKRAFYRDDQNPIVLLDDTIQPAYAACASASGAKAISNTGAIVGERFWNCESSVLSVSTPAIWSSWTSDLYLIFGGYEEPYPGNSRDVNDTPKFIFDWPDGLYTETWTENPWDWDVVPFPLETSQATYSGPARSNGINNAGAVVGTFLRMPRAQGQPARNRAFYWDGSSANSIDLPVLNNARNSTAYEVNNQGFAVGSVEVLFGTTAVVWHEDIGVVALPHPWGGNDAIKVCEAYSVGGRRTGGLVEAVGYCRYNGKRVATRWNIWTKLNTFQF